MEDEDMGKLGEVLQETEEDDVPPKKVPYGDLYEAARAGDVARLTTLLDSGANVNARDAWDSVALYYACLAGHLPAATLLLRRGAICSHHTFDGDRCHYAALNLRIRRLLSAFESRPIPLPPLADSLRAVFFRSAANHLHIDPTLDPDAHLGAEFEIAAPDILFRASGLSLAAHRAVLAARSPFFRRRFQGVWRRRGEIRLARITFSALFSFISFLYCDKLDVLVDDMEEVVRIARVCGCPGLQKVLEKELLHQRYAEYKAYRVSRVDESVRRFILQGSSLPEEERLPAALGRLLDVCLLVDSREEDLADVCFEVDGGRFRCHRPIVAARSDYVRALLEFKRGGAQAEVQVVEDNCLSSDTFHKLLRYIYTDELDEVDLEQAEELLDAASRYLLFPLKRVVADYVLSHLEDASPALLCQWLIVSDIYGVTRVREHCLGVIAAKFESFAATSDFKSMLRRLPPPSGDSSTRTTEPGTYGNDVKDQANLLDDLRETWLNLEGAELDERDESAKDFDRMLEFLRASDLLV